jgi:replicative DNA helicase
MHFTTGLKALDDLLIHPLRPGTLTIYGAAPGDGMTTLLDTAVVAMSINGTVPTILCDLETNTWSHWYRLIAASAGVPLTAVQQGTSGVTAARIAAATSALTSKALTMGKARTVSELAEECQAQKTRFVAVDGSRYLDHSLARPDNHDVLVLNDLKRMAVELNVGVLATTPLVRRPSGGFLGELPGEMHMVADAIVLVRPDPYAEGLTRVADLTVVKNRNGMTGSCKAFGEYTHARFRDIDGGTAAAA